jgi:hypothetical protein
MKAQVGMGPTTHIHEGVADRYGPACDPYVAQLLTLFASAMKNHPGWAVIRALWEPKEGIFMPRARGEWDWATLNSFVNDFVPDGGNGALRNVGNGTFVGNDNAFFWFLQDDVNVSSRLTLKLGIRYEYFGVPRDANNQAFNAVANDAAMALLFTAPKPDTNNFGPRIGFAYDPTGSGKWSIRGGAGYFYDIYPTNFETNNQPLQRQFENTTPGLPARSHQQRPGAQAS